MKNCPYCAKPNPDEAVFCNYCKQDLPVTNNTSTVSLDNSNNKNSDLADLAIQVKCPSCERPFQLPNDVNTFYCIFCGQQIIANRGGGIVYLACTSDKNEEVKGETIIEQGKNLSLAETESKIKVPIITEKGLFTELEQKQQPPRVKTAEERKITELLFQKKVIEERGRKSRLILIFGGAILLAISYAILPTVATYNEFFLELAVVWIPIIFFISIQYMRVMNRLNKNKKFIDDYILRLENLNK
jgi:hypothetical protein